MLREFLSIFRSEDPLSAMGENFTRMLALTSDMTRVAGGIYFAGAASGEERDRIYKEDVEVNKLERTIRKQVVAHLSIRRNTSDLPYCLFLVSLVKDVERIGDYAKNLTEVMDFRPGPLPDDEIIGELQGIRRRVEERFRATPEVVGGSNRERASALIQDGRTVAKECEKLIARIAGSDYDARTAAATVLGTRYYKRIGGHLLNVLSSVVMPLHKVDYFDEDEITRRQAQQP